MRCYAVVDTNVIVSAVITKNPDSPPRQVFRAMLSGDQKHYPVRNFIVTPAEILEILKK